ncbi:hypothetical protein M885DRAFT_590840 [Pelagophyceae sp. CCMP2097]|nr:hypothetical protein M885DRAFT_590840 [Pelagophyceae sp. CCMP2097]|mmetsp:Transcript_7829/g.25539  ORF Transcript_7829/g.25539 Transcript_7829/m.25539 type:complete len:431 (-) Transcript_7829:127-1419(-)
MVVRGRRLCALITWVACGAVVAEQEPGTQRRLQRRAAEDNRATEDNRAAESLDHHDQFHDQADTGLRIAGPTAAMLARWRAMAPPTPNATRGPVRLDVAAKASMGLVDLLEYEQYVNPLCHSVAHAIGEKIFDILGDLDAALSACAYRCTGGCLHGAIHGFVAAAGFPSTPEVLRQAWAGLVQNKRIAELTNVGETAHGFGHTLILQGVALDDALAFCASGLEDAVGADLSFTLTNYCSGGAWMETGDAAAPRLLTDRVAACANAPPLARLACFNYALRAEWETCACCAEEVPACPSAHCTEAACHIDAAENAGGGEAITKALLGLCAGLRGGVRRACLYGAASAASFPLDVHGHIEATIHFCDGVPVGRDRDACIDGLMMRASKYFPSVAVQEICPRMASMHDRDFCLEVAQSGQFSLAKEALMRSYAD